MCSMPVVYIYVGRTYIFLLVYYTYICYTPVRYFNTHTNTYTQNIYNVGTHKPWYFIFDPRYYYTCYRDLRGLPRTPPTTTTTTTTDNTAPHTSRTTVPVEPVATNLASQIDTNTCVQVKGLYKAFYNGFEKKVAVDHLDLTMYSSQITALLGHNGRCIYSMSVYICKCVVYCLYVYVYVIHT